MAATRRATTADAPSWVAARLAAAPGPLLLVTVALAYLALAQLVMFLNDPVSTGASLWPAAGLSLGVLMLVPTSRWGWVLSGVALAELAGDLAWGYPILASIGWALANTVEPLVGAALLRKAGSPRGALAPVQPLLLFMAFAVVTGPLVGATIGSATSAAVGSTPFGEVWPNYLVGDALGVLIVAPVLLASRRHGSRRSARERATLVAGSALTTLAVFSGIGGAWMVTMPYLIIPFFAWAALRFGTYGTAGIGLGVTFVADGFTGAGAGPFAMAAATEGLAVTLLQVFLASTIASALLLAAVVSDLRDRRQMEALLRHQATHDPLTGLPNRMLLAEEMEAAVARSDGEGSAMGLLVCDLDDFKAVNDRVGHQGGDDLLVQVASRLNAGVRPEDFVARISGDEFVVLLHDIDETSIMRVARRVAETVGRPALLGGRWEVQPSVSVGAAVRLAGESAEGLFQMADTAVYEAKRRGRGCVVLADAALRGRARAELRTEDSLLTAFDEGQIVTYFQPIVCLAGGGVAAAEAVVRWRHPDLGLLDAEQFLAAVDATGMGDRLFETALTQAVEAQEQWFRRCGRRLPVSVNVSARQLVAGGVVNVVLRALADSDIPAGAVCLEVTKRAPLDDMAVASLNQLHALGVRVILDGFGSGWASMSHLAEIPWDFLKIDRSFVAELGQDSGPTNVVRAMTAMSGALGIRVAADGVSRISQLDALRALGCDLAQGPLFGRVSTTEELSQILVQERLGVLPSGLVQEAVSVSSDR